LLEGSKKRNKWGGGWGFGSRNLHRDRCRWRSVTKLTKNSVIGGGTKGVVRKYGIRGFPVLVGSRHNWA